ncbi:MAG: D-2-hydroxyacid dehydrogenase [Alphaproteobacteria bacterium]
MRVDQGAWEQASGRNGTTAGDMSISYSQDWEGLEAALTDAEVLICQSKPPEAAIKAAPKLKWIMVTMAGVESLSPLDWLPDGVILSNNSGTHYPKTREFAAMALGMLHFQAPHLFTAQRAHTWSPKFDSLIQGKTVTIVGFGTLGQATADAARGMGLKVRAVRRNPAPHDLADEMFSSDALVQASEGADFLVCTLPLTPATHHMVDAAAFDALKPGAGVVNIGRGPVMDYDALVERLNDDRISGAILDVFDEEPLPADHSLWDQKNLVIFPHMSSDDPSTYIQRTLDIFFQNCRDYRAGISPLPTEISRVTGY